jgi:hypothetical protein
MKTTPAQRLASQTWRERNPEKVAKYVRKRYELSLSDPSLRERQRAAFRKYYRRNKEKFRELNRAYRARPSNKIADRLRSKLRMAMKYGVKRSSIEDLLGCTIEQFREHIAKQFTDGMNWSTHGFLWDLDHLQPCASFDLTDEAQQKLCFDYRNIRPMACLANKIKHSAQVEQPHLEYPTIS